MTAGNLTGIWQFIGLALHIASAVVATGVTWTTQQCNELLDLGVPGLHFYTLNKSSATLAVHAALGL